MKQKIAEMLDCHRCNGGAFGMELDVPQEYFDLAEDCDILIAYCDKNGNLQIRGIIEEEIYSRTNPSACFLYDEFSDEFITLSELRKEQLEEENATLFKVEVIDGEAIAATWQVKANVPYVTFNILEDTGFTTFCQGIVIEKSDITNLFQ